SSIPPPTSPAPSPRHDDPTGQAGAPAREGWRHPHVTRWSRVSNGGNAMNTTTVRTRFVLILALLVFATFAATSSTLACVVGTGGGAISSGGTVTTCTIPANSATFPSGAIPNPGSLTVTNSTFSGNSATLGGAISNEGTLTVTNSILANSTSGGNCGVPAGITAIFTHGGHNIDDATTCGFRGTNCSSTTGTSFCNTNPLLDPAGLASNGGPTQTIALEAGSPAINAGDETVCAAPPV